MDDLWSKPLGGGVLNAHEPCLLYRLIHFKGCGHLLCINWLEGAAKYY
ncbi:hypothetical protein PanWU01x14_116090 [Parasponia andersonii]|uniref:Uncharacterized protein n=1 Tax=Parasponia andersonii TaxID=3476 RepID=A0A2P5CX46_PARAD|nr:hypothetical protein PanWU01x14_116090 [Parasponia andersonii]